MKVLDEMMTNGGPIGERQRQCNVVKRGGGTCNITVNGVEIECEENEIPGSNVA